MTRNVYLYRARSKVSWLAYLLASVSNESLLTVLRLDLIIVLQPKKRLFAVFSGCFQAPMSIVSAQQHVGGWLCTRPVYSTFYIAVVRTPI